jgi:hypothetical protein
LKENLPDQGKCKIKLDPPVQTNGPKNPVENHLTDKVSCFTRQ